jgi:hypothetical protein
MATSREESAIKNDSICMGGQIKILLALIGIERTKKKNKKTKKETKQLKKNPFFLFSL